MLKISVPVKEKYASGDREHELFVKGENVVLDGDTYNLKELELAITAAKMFPGVETIEGEELPKPPSMNRPVKK